VAWSTPKTWVTDEVVTASDLNTHLRDQLNAILPVGTLIVRVAPYTEVEMAVEGRWLQCNGVAVSRTTYATLFNYLNSLTPALPFGSGDGTTTFNLPDLRGRTVYAEGTNANVDDIGDNEGQSLANRGPHHHHRFTLEQPVSGNGSDAAAGNTIDTGANGTTTGGAAQDKPAYLVVGSYFIKYTA
jgi:microcystin-dependent protein